MSNLYDFFFLMMRRPPRSPLFPYPTLSRSQGPLDSSGNRGPRGATSSPAAEEPPLSRPDRPRDAPAWQDRKSTRLNSSHANISYAVFCLKKKKSRRVYLQTSTKL